MTLSQLACLAFMALVDSLFQYQVPPKSPAFSIIRILVIPASIKRTATSLKVVGQKVSHA